jgi:hypothetical protein
LILSVCDQPCFFAPYAWVGWLSFFLFFSLFKYFGKKNHVINNVINHVTGMVQIPQAPDCLPAAGRKGVQA